MQKKNYGDLSSASSYYSEETFTDSPQRENTGQLYIYIYSHHAQFQVEEMGSIPGFKTVQFTNIMQLLQHYI